MFAEEQILEILEQIHTLCHPVEFALTGWEMRRGDGAPEPIPATGIWGGHCETYTFENTIRIPDQLAGKCVEFTLLTGKEGQWDATNPQFTVHVNGELRQGFDVNHTSLVLSENAQPTLPYHILLQAYTGVQNFHLEFKSSLRTVDGNVVKYYYDLLTPLRVARLCAKDSPEYLRLIRVLKESIHALDLRKPGSAACLRSIAEADEILQRGLYAETPPVGPTVFCVGHTHIDVAWLWTLSVTEDKAVRSF